MKTDRRYIKLGLLTILLTVFSLGAATLCNHLSGTTAAPHFHLLLGLIVAVFSTIGLCWLVNKALYMFNVDVLYEKHRSNH